MPAPFPAPKRGIYVGKYTSAFPAFFTKRQPRIIVSDIWAYIRSLIPERIGQNRKKEARAYVDQAFEFYEAARNPRTSSKPLLYYYTFLNLAKVVLLIHRVKFPPKAKHGIDDPKSNFRYRMRLDGQIVHIKNQASDHSEIFPEFYKCIGGSPAPSGNRRVIDLLSQMPCIHLAYSRVTKKRPNFLPIKGCEIFRNKDSIWARIVVEKPGDETKIIFRALKKRRSFSRNLKQVAADSQNEIWFDTKEVLRSGSGLDKGIALLQKKVQEIGIWSIMTSNGYRHYFCSIEPRKRLPQLASIYALMYYLGSITRYKPQDFDKIIEAKYGVLMQEAIATQPSQFLYLLASCLSGVDVVRPFSEPSG